MSSCCFQVIRNVVVLRGWLTWANQNGLVHAALINYEWPINVISLALQRILVLETTLWSNWPLIWRVWWSWICQEITLLVKCQFAEVAYLAGTWRISSLCSILLDLYFFWRANIRFLRTKHRRCYHMALLRFMTRCRKWVFVIQFYVTLRPILWWNIVVAQGFRKRLWHFQVIETMSWVSLRCGICMHVVHWH